MKRRDLIKTGLLGLGASAVALSGCDKEKEVSISKESEIIPQQTGLYEFSVPLPFNFKTIDEIIEMNSTLKKSKVVSFYNNSPNQNFNCWVSIERASVNKNIKNYEQFGQYVEYAIKNGFKFTYLMNSPKPFSEKDYNTFKDEFYYLLDYLYKIGCRDIKVANPQVAELINDKTKRAFNLHVSTAFEYHNISQYTYLFNNYPNFTLIDVTNDENQNFTLLKALREKFPDVKLELMVNEFCIKGCPARISHISENSFMHYECIMLENKFGKLHNFLKSGVIFPWNLEYYSAIGINNFKYISQLLGNTRADFHDISRLRTYLDIVENGVENHTADFFFTKLFDKLYNYMYATSKEARKTKLSELKKLLPDIRYFIANGDKCSTRCGLSCDYCAECARNVDKRLSS